MNIVLDFSEIMKENYDQFILFALLMFYVCRIFNVTSRLFGVTSVYL